MLHTLLKMSRYPARCSLLFTRSGDGAATARLPAESADLLLDQLSPMAYFVQPDPRPAKSFGCEDPFGAGRGNRTGRIGGWK